MGTHPIFESDFDCLTDRSDLFARMTDRKAVIKNADMSEDMQTDAVECATQALEKYNIEKDIAAYIKKEFDKKYSPTWHCIVGRNFGSYVTHETKHFIYFYLGQVKIDQVSERLTKIFRLLSFSSSLDKRNSSTSSTNSSPSHYNRHRRPL